MTTTSPAVTIDGALGGTVNINPNLPNVQVSVSKRDTGVLTFTGKSSGSDVFEAFQPALTLDLSMQRTAVINDYSMDMINVSVSPSGADFDITVTQW